MSDRNSDRGGDRNNDRGYRGGGRGRYRGGDRGGGGDRGYIGRNQPYEGERESRGGDRGGDRDYGGGYRGGRGGRGRGDYNNSRQEETARLTCANMFESPDNPDNELGGNPVIEDCGERFGTYGDKITLAANYFRVTHLPQRTLYQYSVEFSPVIESLHARYAILMKTNILTKKVAAFDGSVLYIPFFIEPGDYMSMDRQENPIKITLKHVATVAPGSPPASTVINLIMRRVMKNLDLKLIKRHHFDPQAPISFQEGHLEIWPGYSSTLTYFGKIPFYCVDVAHHVIRQQSAMDFLAQVLQDTREKSSAKQHLERHLVGKVVMTRYNNRSYRIDAIDWELSPNSTFDKKDGTKISYKDYYDQHYNIQIRDNDQPLLVSVLKERRRLHEQKQAEQKGESKPPTEMVVHLIPELVYLTGVSDEVRTNFHMMRGFADITRVNPTRRCNNIYKFLDRVYENPDSKTYLDNWGVEFKKQLVTIPARHFAPESIIFGNRSYSVNPNNYDWNSSLRDCQLLNPAQISNWAVYHSSRDNNAARAFTEAVADRARDFNFQLSQPKMIQINSQNCSELASLIERNNPNDYEVSMFMIPPNRKDLYDMIKTVCCVDSPQVTQVILTSTINKTKGIQSIASKVAIQLCVKRGGEPWTVSIPVKKKMVVGIDVCHDTESKRNSWLGFVASLNDSFTRYFSRATRQPPKTEIADSLNINMKAALESYFKLNGYLPDAIYVFRDGVGDGQLEMVRLQEIPSIMTCLKAIYSEYNVIPTLAYIVVRKRVNARLFTFSRDEASNPEPGSVVDRVITKDDYPNFYLISQKVNQGTVNPTHYIILYNNSKLSTNNIQRLSYKLTHLYFNWTGTVRVPAPCQYAHKLCFLVSQSVKKEPSTQLSNLLYYL